MNCRISTNLLAIGVLLVSVAPVAMAAKLIGPHRNGSYEHDATIRYFLFKYSGRLDAQTVDSQARAVVRKLVRENRTAKRPLARYGISLVAPPPAGKAWLEQGEVFAMGYYDQTNNRLGWVAMNDTRFMTNGKASANNLPEVWFNVGGQRELFYLTRGNTSSYTFIDYTIYDR